MKILIIEDDIKVADFIQEGLKQANHVAVKCLNGRDGLAEAMSGGYDAVICDRMLPDIDGVAIPGCLRSTGIDTPVIMLTALDDVSQRVEGLKAGADDYLCKPFAFSELFARLESLVRRQQPVEKENELRIADLNLQRLKRTVRRGGKVITLQPREFRLLEYMMLNSGHVVTRTMLLENVWDINFDPQD